MAKKYAGYTNDMLVKMLEEKDQEIKVLQQKVSELEGKASG